jgi:hypothetical protein
MSGWRVDQVPPMSLPVASSDSHSGVRRAIARRSSSDVSSSLASASSRPWSCNIFRHESTRADPLSRPGSESLSS